MVWFYFGVVALNGGGAVLFVEGSGYVCLCMTGLDTIVMVWLIFKYSLLFNTCHGILIREKWDFPQILLFQPGLRVKVCCVYYCTLHC